MLWLIHLFYPKSTLLGSCEQVSKFRLTYETWVPMGTCHPIYLLDSHFPWFTQIFFLPWVPQEFLTIWPFPVPINWLSIWCLDFRISCCLPTTLLGQKFLLCAFSCRSFMRQTVMIHNGYVLIYFFSTPLTLMPSILIGHFDYQHCGAAHGNLCTSISIDLPLCFSFGFPFLTLSTYINLASNTSCSSR